MGERCLCSFVYASNSTSERRNLWRDLYDIHSNYVQNCYPWILLEDFNVILSSNEHSRAGNYLPSNGAMREFQDTIVNYGLMDLSFVGSLYTWINNQEKNPIGKKLDRALVNGCRLTEFPLSYNTFEAGGV